jgi:hypothetical protein
MHEVTCDGCGGSGKMRRGEMKPGIDWSFDFSQGFARMCSSQATKDEHRDRCVAFLKTLKPGARVMSNGQFEREIVSVGMYDGWPFWTPTPAISYIGPLGSLEYDFYYNLSAPWVRA